jgi:hypothetical protein
MSSTLTDFQDAFCTAIAAPEADPAGDLRSLVAQPGFAIHRNTVAKGCIDALAANYPTVAKLVGEEWLRGAAALFSRANLPRHPALVLYGEDFPDFLAGFAPAAQLPYLADVARIDRLWTEAHTAADAQALDPRRLATLPAPELGRAVLVPHPAARWGYFPAHPAYTIWRDNREERGQQGTPAWKGEGTLLTRPQGDVIWHALDEAGVAFLDACADGHCVGEAAARALAACPDADLGELMSVLARSGAFTDLALPRNPTKEDP